MSSLHYSFITWGPRTASGGLCSEWRWRIQTMHCWERGAASRSSPRTLHSSSCTSQSPAPTPRSQDQTLWTVVKIIKNNSSSPDPDADTEVGQSHQQHHDVGDEEEVLSALQPAVHMVHVILPHSVVVHLPTSLLFGSQYYETILDSALLTPNLTVGVLLSVAVSNILAWRCHKHITMSILWENISDNNIVRFYFSPFPQSTMQFRNSWMRSDW